MQGLYDNAIELTLTDKAVEYTKKVKANERNPLVAIYLSLLNLGVENITEPSQKKYTRICNFIAVNTIASIFIYVPLAIFWESWIWLGAILMSSTICVVVLCMNAFGKTKMARVSYLIGSNTLIFISGLIIGPLAKEESFFILSTLIPFLIFDIKDIRYIIAGVVLPVTLFCAFSYVSPYFMTYNLAHYQQMFLYHIGVIMQFALALAGVYQFVFYSKMTERKLELSNQQMTLQTNELKRSNSDLEQFAYIISHDLKAPVRNISSFMNLLVNKFGSNMNPEALEFVEYSRSGAKRMERLIEDILAYCKIGTNLPNPMPVNLNDVISTIRFESREKLNSMNGKINIVQELPVINNVHSTLLYHVFQNLIANGLKFNKSKEPQIDISWTNSLNYYTFSVSDNGIGISKDYAATVFQMFKRLHTESEYDGTGIGLAICKKIVGHYNGEIWFEKNEAGGTTFHFTIRKF